MHAKQLIGLNNEKRERLTRENEQYYSDFLIYLRLQLSLSEQKTEELLMEILDHLLDAQSEGKTASEVFGADPKTYADEMIAFIPKEDKKDVFQFGLSIAFNLAGWFLSITSLASVIQFFLGQPAERFYIYKTSIMLLLILLSVSAGVPFIFKLIKRSLFKQKNNEVLTAVKGGLFGALAAGIVIAAGFFIPETGPYAQVQWYILAAAAAAAFGFSYFLKRRL
ncbi:DUF1129 family protein [Metabacillus mangrovi]|uniref:DUF1129 family protein n=1 Tax=Metabacillus mangrovi TaxID=1491830 RepID=UPI001391E4BC|nr:DUF1129 family protein [Metabacillus mangrovi]